MKKSNKSRKGFTIVELVIVIAVIAILAAVLIPTFSNVISKANHSAALQEARNKYLEVFADDIADDGTLNGSVVEADGKGYTYTTSGGSVTGFTFDKDGITVTYDVANDDWTVNGESQGNSGGQTPGETPVAVTEVTLDQTALALTVGGTEKLTATVAPDNATNKTVAWGSSDPTVATVDQDGSITAVAAGETTITVTSTADPTKSATCTVTVSAAVVNVDSVTLPQTLALTVGGTEKLTATVAPNDATDKSVTWSSDNTAVATVDHEGNVTAVGIGSATITVTSTADSTKSATCTVTVSAAVVDVTGVSLNKETLELQCGNGATKTSEQLVATVAPDNATNKKVTWTSSAPSVATVNETTGEVTAVGMGTTTITATTEDGGKTDTCIVTVSKVVQTGFSDFTKAGDGSTVGDANLTLQNPGSRVEMQQYYKAFTVEADTTYTVTFNVECTGTAPNWGNIELKNYGVDSWGNKKSPNEGGIDVTLGDANDKLTFVDEENKVFVETSGSHTFTLTPAELNGVNTFFLVVATGYTNGGTEDFTITVSNLKITATK